MKTNKGNITVFVLVFAAVFSMLVYVIINNALLQGRLIKSNKIKQKAFLIAESGISYAAWFSSRFPNDAQDGTGQPGPYVHTVKDEESGKVIGEFSLEIKPKSYCGEINYLDVKSTGKSYENPNITKELSARIIKPSVAEFSYLINADVWAGSDRQIIGPYHSNGGIRMDGTNNSTVTSAKSSWFCTSSFGCSYPTYVPGVFGSGPNNNLWAYPRSPIDFNTLNIDLNYLKDLAQNKGGIYLPEFTGNSGDDRKGYLLVFKNNGTVDIYKVNYATWYWGYRDEYGYDYSWYYGWRRERNRITSKSYMGNYQIPSECSLIFSEEKLWVEGVINGKVTVVAARTSGSYKPEVVLNDNIIYGTGNGKDGITILAQSYILIPEFSPNNMELNGIFIAQEGSFGRSYYKYNTRNQLIINGSVVSNKRVGTSWGCPYFCSGYAQRINSYDRFLRYAPPPFTPNASSTLQIVNWSEK